MAEKNEESKEIELVRIAAARGIFFPSAEIFDSTLSGFWDYGPIGLRILNNVISKWRNLLEEVNAYEIAGKIDELKLEKGTVSIIDDKAVDAEKAGASDYVPRTYAVQLSLYRKLLSDIRSRRYSYENFASSRKLGSMPLSKEFEMALAEIGVRDSLMSVEGIYKKMFEELYALPEISSRLELRYIDNRSREHLKSIFIQYDEKQLTDVLRDCMKYWNGERDARPVPMKERWKCKRCRFFGNECKVWFGEEEGKVA